MEAEGEKSPEEKSGVKADKEERPKFGPRPNFESDDFDFKTELERLPFTLNVGRSTSNRGTTETVYPTSI